MDIMETVNQRKSIRAFRPDPVPREILKGLMELALRAPSWANTQPWEFAVVGGEKLEEIRQAFTEKAGEQPDPDLPYPQEFPEPYSARRRAVGMKLFEIKGIGREDKERRKWWGLQSLRMFEAPCVIYIYIDRHFHLQADSLNFWPVFDCGLVAENIMLLATKHGLGTIPLIRSVDYPDTLRRVLAIPDSKLIVLGIAIGYPDWDDPINQFRSEREPLDRVTNWHGFD